FIRGFCFIVSIALDTFCSCKSWALQLQNTRGDGGRNSFSVVLDGILRFKNWHFYNIKSLEMTTELFSLL
uniref:hypothetical protein n=1 Tax=Flavobacterium sp. TaxID=239 RepID=UPI00404ACB35